ncbi:MAG TPA: isochorismatase family protein [Acidimicrobiia bacterium]|jgi:nicotinamidase-related amidase
MPRDLAGLLDPPHTAVLTMELQRGVVGDSAAIAPLAEEVAARGIVAAAARVVDAARRAGACVVHCTAEFRSDRAGSRANAPLLRALAKGSPHPLAGSDAAAVVPELGPEPGDLLSPRTHGLTPFPGTGLDQLLRNLEIRTVVATGVSLNVGVPGLVMVAVDLGYDVVVVTDAVAGIPRQYGDAVLEHTIAPLATRATADEVVDTWARLQRA